MSVEVRVTSVLQKVVGGKSVQGEGKTIGEVLEGINAQYPGFREQITQGDGSLHRFVNIYINDEDIRFMQQLLTPVSEGDVVSILPALAGGAPPDDAFILRPGSRQGRPRGGVAGLATGQVQDERPKSCPDFGLRW